MRVDDKKGGRGLTDKICRVEYGHEAGDEGGNVADIFLRKQVVAYMICRRYCGF